MANATYDTPLLLYNYRSEKWDAHRLLQAVTISADERTVSVHVPTKLLRTLREGQCTVLLPAGEFILSVMPVYGKYCQHAEQYGYERSSDDLDTL